MPLDEILIEAMDPAGAAYRSWERRRTKVRRAPQAVSVNRPPESPEGEVLGELAGHPRCMVCYQHVPPDQPGSVRLVLYVFKFPYFKASALCSHLCRRALYYHSSYHFKQWTPER